MAESASQPQRRATYLLDLSGTSVGRFAILARLGRGGMGEVYRADDTKLKRPVAVKRITRAADERYRQRLWSEAQSASRLSDPHIAAVYDVLEQEGELFLVMEYVEGETLRRSMAEPMPIAKFLDIAMDCAEALAVAHNSGVLHRDIKPENIMLTPTKGAKILDFGVAARLPSATVTSTQIDDSSDNTELSGTLAYMAPEVLEERESSARSDIFSLGVVFYEALAGRHPFLAQGFLATCNRILREDPRPLREFNSRVPAEFERIVNKMLAKDPAERYVSADDLLVDLRALQRARNLQSSFTSPAGTASPASSPGTTRERTPGKRRVLASVLVGTIACAAVLAVLAYKWFAPPVLAAHDSMLVTDFENHSGEPLFDDTVSESLGHSLQESHYVTLVPRRQAVEAARRAGHTDVTHVDEDLGRQICERENCRVLLTGEINKASAGYQINVRVVDAARGVPVLADSAPVRSPAELYEAVDALSKRLRRHLGESLAQVEKQSIPLARVTTPSLEALQRYSAAVKRNSAGDTEGFLRLAKSAVEIDPDFAMAHLNLALTYEQLGNRKESQAHLAQARRRLDRVSERERYLIRALDYAAQGLEEKSLEQYRLLTELYPDDVEGYQGLAAQSIWVGRPQDAIAAEKHLLQLDPHSAIDHERLMLWLDHVNNFSEALTVYSTARSGGVTAPVLHWGAGLAHLGLDDQEGARREFSLLAQEGGDYEKGLASLYSARVSMYEGRLREATEALRHSLLLDEKLHSETWTPVKRYLLGAVLLARGETAEAHREVRKLAAAVIDGNAAEELRRTGIQAVAQGELGAARQLLSQLGRLNDSEDTGYTHSCYYNLKGTVELAEGKTEAAEESQHRAAVFYPSFRTYYAAGEVYAAEHEWTRAGTAFQRYLDFKGEVIGDDSPSDWVLGNLRVARILAQSGDAKQSLQYYDHFLRLWANADADLPVLREARAERAHLARTISSVSSSGGPPSG
jgi:serine/threonine protein kinase/tetratricopeptide (TPR) repeat protein